MKYIIILAMNAGLSLDELGVKLPEYARTPNLDLLASCGKWPGVMLLMNCCRERCGESCRDGL